VIPYVAATIAVEVLLSRNTSNSGCNSPLLYVRRQHRSTTTDGNVAVVALLVLQVIMVVMWCSN
ncbi:Hypothetical predicted protein, partial [Olea europaea subsp. europaea]